MNDDERARVLRMVAEGKLSPEEAAGLLDALEPETRGAGYSSPPGTPGEGEPGVRRIASPRPVGAPGRGRSPRAVVIQIKEGGDNKVNVRIPLGLARAAGKFIPRQAQTYLANYEIDLQEFLEGAGDMEGGTLLEVKDGENRVLIAVE
jgi:hypothetical protein